jgi:AcrR family transcriptional regulator
MARKIRQSPKLPAEKRREQLLSAARKLFVRKGYRGTTTEEIARAAGVTKGALYFHFDSKEEILLELLKVNAETMGRVVNERLADKGNLLDYVRLLLESHCGGRPRDFGDVVDLWIQGFRVPRVRRYISSRMRRGMTEIADFIRSSGGVGRHHPEDTAVFLMAMIDGLSAMRLLLPRRVDIDAQVGLFAARGEGCGSPQRRRPGGGGRKRDKKKTTRRTGTGKQTGDTK